MNKQIKRRLAGSLALALTLAAGAAMAQTVEPPTKAGTMKLVQGDVRVIDAQGERMLQPGDTVSPADRLVTGPDGAASMVLRDGTTMMLGPRSRVTLDSFAFNSTTNEGNLVVAVLRGSMRMITGLISKANPQSVLVKTRTATVGVRGTDFIVEVDEEAAP